MDVTGMALPFFGLSPQTPYPQANQETNIKQSKLKDVLQNIWPVHLDTFKAIQSKESLVKASQWSIAQGDRHDI